MYICVFTCRQSMGAMSGINGEDVCVLVCLVGALCGLVGIIKYVDGSGRTPQRTACNWISTGVMKIVSSLVVYNTPQTTVFHKSCCVGCIISLIISSFGAFINLLNCQRSQLCDDNSEFVMATGTLLSFAFAFVKVTVYKFMQ